MVCGQPNQNKEGQISSPYQWQGKYHCECRQQYNSKKYL